MIDAAFVSTTNLKQNALINGNVEDSVLRVVIVRQQRLVVRPLLGTSLYKRLVAGITADDLNADEKELLDEYIAPLMYVCCDRAAINATTYQLRNKAASKGTDKDFAPISESENLRLDNSIRPSIVSEQNTLIGYMLDNCDLYPEYNNAECSYEMKPPSTTNAKGYPFYMT